MRAPRPSLGMPTHEPLGDSLCSMTRDEVAEEYREWDGKREMPGSGTMAQVIKDPKEASQHLWHSIQCPSTNHPTRPPREPRRSHAMPRGDEPSLTRSIFSRPVGRVKRAGFAPLNSAFMTSSLEPPHLPTHQEAKRHNNCCPARRLVFPRQARLIQSP
jgi:hypothetical protein